MSMKSEHTPEFKQSYQDAIVANIEVHTRLAAEYNKSEPHFRPESIARVKSILEKLAVQIRPSRALDLGCGTGFMIDLLKPHVSHITGVDITPAMMKLVDKSGPTRIELIERDTGTVELEPGSYDLVTAYSFLDHLFDLAPTFKTAVSALRAGGKFYADLNPNSYFWAAIKDLAVEGKYSSEVTRELAAVLHKDKEIQEQFGIEAETFKKAEFQKHIQGGLKEEEIRNLLLHAGFKQVEFMHHWFVGQAHLVNSSEGTRQENLAKAAIVHESLNRMLPLSRHLFKYVGFIATK